MLSTGPRFLTALALLLLAAPAVHAQEAPPSQPGAPQTPPPQAAPPAQQAPPIVVQTSDAWKSATELPNVDFSGLDAAQKATALEALRTIDCTCRCNLKVAQCRIQDPNCPVSPGLANEIVKEVQSGKTLEAIKAEHAEKARAAAAAQQAAVPATPMTPPKPPEPKLHPAVEIVTKGAPVKGPTKAKVTLVEFSDFQCPYCAGASKWAEEILAAFPKDVKLVFKQYPLPFHKQAKMAAEASLFANAQGKFWELHDKMFTNGPAQVNRENLVAWAKEIGLDGEKLAKELDAGTYGKVVDEEIAEGNKVGVRGTPTFFVNGKRYEGPRTLEAIKPLIAAEISGKPAASTN